MSDWDDKLNRRVLGEKVVIRPVHDQSDIDRIIARERRIASIVVGAMLGLASCGLLLIVAALRYCT